MSTRPGAACRAPLLLALFAVVEAVHGLSGYRAWSSGGAIEAVLYTGIELGALAMVAGRALRGGPDALGWALVAGYLLLWSAGDLGWTLHYDHVAEPPFPNWTDGAYLLSYGCAYAGLMVLLRGQVRHAGASQWLDGIIGGLALGAVCAALVFGPILKASSGSPTTVAVTLAYPALDVMFLCLLGVTFGLLGWRPPRMWWLLGLAVAVGAVGDSAYAYLEASDLYGTASWVNVTWPIEMTLIALAARCPQPVNARPRTSHLLFLVPVTFAMLALGVVTWSVWRPVPAVGTLLAIGALLAAGARAILMQLENVALLRSAQRQALTDKLTGLPNRRALVEHLDTVFGDEEGPRPATLALFDLDGFKSYNDTFGHVAGDALLSRLGAALAAATAEHGSAYRLGGDEFCVLLERRPGEHEDVVRRASLALSEHGDGFTITASCGRVRLPADARTQELALRLADERMYLNKDARRRRSPRRQARDLLLQVLREREPDLGEHVDDVGALAIAVGCLFGLETEALDELARAAELHDIGKVAVPDTILRKPGPLDPVEWQIMRQHTIVGERILAAAPALRPVAVLVRSSHEHWDGGGYPDGLAGEEIPLGARIIAVCDAFDAMRQERPYAPTMSEDEALAELRRCAGSQFDPAVVDALAVALREGAGAELRVA